MDTQTNNLPSTLTDVQLKKGIDSLMSQGAPQIVIQNTVDNYQSDGNGGYSLKVQKSNMPSAINVQPQNTQSSSMLNGIIPSSQNAGSLDYKLSNLDGTLGGIASGAYNAGKGLLNLGKDAAVDTFNTINHPIDSIGKGYDYLKNEVVNQGSGNENTDSIGKLFQSTLGSKGALGVGQQLGNAFNDTTGQTNNTFSDSKLTGDIVNSIMTAITGGMGGKTLTAPLLESSVGSLLESGAITKPIADAVIKYGTGLLGKSIESGVAGAGFQTASNLQENRPLTENMGKSFAAGLAVPSILEVGNAVVSKTVSLGKSA